MRLADLETAMEEARRFLDRAETLIATPTASASASTKAADTHNTE